MLSLLEYKAYQQNNEMDSFKQQGEKLLHRNFKILHTC